jgi:LysR family hydrogen peroxide-inducible transcriptional activator
MTKRRSLSDRFKATVALEALRRDKTALARIIHQTSVISFGLDGSSLFTLVQMVGAGIGVMLIPDMAVGVETRSAPVFVTRFQIPPPTRTVGLVWRKTNPMADALAQIGDIVLGTARN